MATTSVEAVLHLRDNTQDIKTDSSISATNNRDFANINNIKNNQVSFPKFTTLEHNINVLDGTINHIKKGTTNNNISYISTQISNVNCIMSSPVSKIRIQFDEPTSIDGLTFYFGGKVSAGSISVNFIEIVNGQERIKLGKQITPNSDTYYLKVTVKYIKIIDIIFNKTRFPKVSPKLQNIDFGENYYFSDDKIISCTIDEEVFPISTMLPINTCDITLYSKENKFNPFVKDSMFYALSNDSSINIYGIYNGERFQMGKFYLDTWDTTKDYELTLHCISTLGKLDKIKYYNGGLMQQEGTTITAEDLLEKILYSVGFDAWWGWSNYKIQNDLPKVYIGGELPIKTYREAIQLVAFTAGYYIDDTRDGIVKIDNSQHTNNLFIDSSVVFEPIKITENEDITKINLEITDYLGTINISDENLIFSGILNDKEKKSFILDKPIASADYKLTSSETWNPLPYEGEYKGKYKITITADNGTNSYDLRVQYYESEKIHISKDIKTDRQVKTNEISVNDPLLFISPFLTGIQTNVDEFVDRLKDYYNYNKYKLEFECIINDRFKTGETASIYTQYNQLMIGTIIKQHINLSGGFISTITMLANNKDLRYDYYATNGSNGSPGTITGNYELICGDNILI